MQDSVQANQGQHEEPERHARAANVELQELPNQVPGEDEDVIGWSSDSEGTNFEECDLELADLAQGRDNTPNQAQNPHLTHTEPSTRPHSPSPMPTRPTSPSSVASTGEDFTGPKKPGAPIASHLPALEQLHQKKMALGEAPSAPFADFLEFEFVKWMVERDISQGSRDRLIKLPLVSEYAF
jgi:hypothetical protein